MIPHWYRSPDPRLAAQSSRNSSSEERGHERSGMGSPGGSGDRWACSTVLPIILSALWPMPAWVWRDVRSVFFFSTSINISGVHHPLPAYTPEGGDTRCICRYSGGLKTILQTREMEERRTACTHGGESKDKRSRTACHLGARCGCRLQTSTPGCGGKRCSC